MDPSASMSSLVLEPLPHYATRQDIVIDDPAAISQPPNYSIAMGRPLRPIIYTFSDWNENTMLLVPPGPSGEPSNPLYRISTSLNVHPFVPLSIKTTIRRGGTPQGPFVGLFEIGTPSRAYTKVGIGNRTAKLTTFLTQTPGVGSSRHWLWTFDSIKLVWDCRRTLDDGSPLCICYHGVRHDQLAILVPPPLESFAYPPTEPTLTVFPDGHGEYFDHILLSGLAVHRMLPV